MILNSASSRCAASASHLAAWAPGLLSALLCAGLFSTGNVARADGALSFELPPSPTATASASALSKAPAAHTSVTPKRAEAGSRHISRSGSRSRLASRGGQSRERVMGKLGRLNRQTGFYSTSGRHAHLLTSAPSGTYVAIQDYAGDRIGVLMADGSTAWVAAGAVQTLDFQVVSSGVPPVTSQDILAGGTVPLLQTDAQPLLQEAYNYMGVRYVWGGNTTNGIDCSGFVKNVFGTRGYRLPRTATEQMAYGVAVSPDQLQPGDRLYFGHKPNNSGVTHTGIYVGNGYFIHSSSSRHGVAVSSLSEPMFRRIFVCARR